MASPSDGRRERGDATRRAALALAVQIASREGLAGLSIGRVAAGIDASKSGVAGLFGSRRDLELATVGAAREIFAAAVVAPALAAPYGLPRLTTLMTSWLRYSETRVFEGGCFFRAVGPASPDGPIRRHLAEIDSEWAAFVERTVRKAAPELPSLDDAGLLATDLLATLGHANASSLLHDSDAPYRLAEASIRARLLAAGADAGKLPAAL